MLGTYHLWRAAQTRAHVWPGHWALDPVVLGHRMLAAAGVSEWWASSGYTSPIRDLFPLVGPGGAPAAMAV